MPFLLEGSISYIPTRLPSNEEMKINQGNYLLLTPNTPEWNPHTKIYSEQEYGMMDYNGNIKQNTHRKNYIYQNVSSITNKEQNLRNYININDNREDPIACPNHLISSIKY